MSFEKFLNSSIKAKKNFSILASPIKIKLLCNWCDSYSLRELWNKMSKGDYTWGYVKCVLDEPDYYIIINSTHEYHNKNKSIVFIMEPYLKFSYNFLHVFSHDYYNNMEWHLSLTYNQLSLAAPKKTHLLSTVLSEKYFDPGHKKRIDFVKYIENDIDIDVYGSNLFQYKKYISSLPPYQKDNAIFRYKYTFNVENNSIKNYVTEKLIDGILGECLVFYSGCPNIKEIIDERAYVYLELKDFKHDMDVIKKAIEEDWYTQRLEYIRKEKNRILNELQFFPRIENYLFELEFKKL
jgi:hypothetical protein